MPGLTEDDLKAIEKRANAASPGPWEAKRFGPCNCGECPEHVNVFAGSHQWPNINPPEAEFIAAAREDVPALIAEIRRLRAELVTMGELARAACERAKLAEDGGVTIQIEVKRLRALCARAAHKLGEYWDDGPLGQGWQSAELTTLVSELWEAATGKGSM
jgi:hypothetical protein